MMDDKRQRILQAALKIFLRYGYRRATMDDVAREVGISRPALYLTFPGKEAIFRDVVAMGHDELFRDILAGLPAQSSLTAKLRHVFEIWSVRPFEMVARSPAANELVTSSYDFANDLFERAAQRLASILTDIISAAVDDPGALQPSAEVRARILIASAHGFKYAARDAHDMRSLVHDLVRIVVAGLPAHTEATQDPGKPRLRRNFRRRNKTR